MAFRVLLTLVLTSAVQVWSYPEGPPVVSHPDICESMSPQAGHGYGSSNHGDAPFTISCQGDTYSAGQTITVTIERVPGDDTHKIEGLFVQARLQGAGKPIKPIGYFFDVPDGTAAITCGKPADAWAQTTELEATSASVSWRAPPCDLGPIAFKATVVGDPKEQYWTGLLSDQITFTGANATDCTIPPPPEGSPNPGDGGGDGDDDGDNDGQNGGGNNGASGIGVSPMAAMFGVMAVMLGYLRA